MTADISGRCTQCLSKYTLLSNYTCVFITALDNCKIVDQKDYQRCVSCNEGFFANGNGKCEPLPMFCKRYDPDTKTCSECSADGVVDKNGNCVDKNCKIFDL